MLVCIIVYNKYVCLQCVVYGCQTEPCLPEGDVVAIAQQLLEMGNEFHGMRPYTLLHQCCYVHVPTFETAQGCTCIRCDL